MRRSLTRSQLKEVDGLVDYFVANRKPFETLVKVLYLQISESELFSSLIHSVKGRAKDPKHLRDKLIKKYCECIEAKKPFQITKNTLFEEINDLAGIRILHLYTRQIVSIDTALKRFFEEGGYKMIGPPFAYTWDDESRDYFKEIGIETKDNKRLYTSVHYVIEANKKYTVEIQVRTLAEELWGEVDHTINYPTPTENLACSEQIKVLARVTSSCTRLVDSIFKTYAGMKGR